MTTVARGFWTSAPAPEPRAIGTKPRLATNADITTELPALAGGTTHSSTSLTINPIVTFLSVGYKF